MLKQTQKTCLEQTSKLHPEMVDGIKILEIIDESKNENYG